MTHFAEHRYYAETPRERLERRLNLSHRSVRWFHFAAFKRAERARRGRLWLYRNRRALYRAQASFDTPWGLFRIRRKS